MKKEFVEIEGLTKIQQDLLQPVHKPSLAGKLWIRFLLIIILIGTFAFINQQITGLGITAMRDYSSWGLYIAQFVFLVAVSLVGSLVTAILKLSNQKWATPITRISELIAVAAVMFAAIMIIIDMGRPERLLNVFKYGRIQSPILWDVTVVNTYLFISLLLLYIPLIPDIALMRDKFTDKPKWQQKLYKILALNWKGTEEQHKIIKRTVGILIILILPLAFGIHTVTSWLFAVNNRAGWNSTIFGPYFVSGAFMVGAAAVIVAMYVVQKQQKLQNYITDFHFDKMAKLLSLTSILYFYFNINEFLVPAFKMQRLEGLHLSELFSGEFSMLFWVTQIFGLIIPIILIFFKYFRKPLPIFIISVFVVIGAWLKRVLIVIPTQFHPQFPIQNVPHNFHYYFPTWQEFMISMATIAGALLVISLFIRMFPIVPVWEIEKEQNEKDSNEQ